MRMAKNLVIVESPAKARTLTKYLGRNYQVKASVGHVVDLPKSKLGRRRRERLPARVPGHPRQEEGASTSSRRPRRTRTRSSSRPTPIARARRSRGTSRSTSASRKNVLRVLFNEITKKAVAGGAEAPAARSTRTSSRPSRRAASSTGWSATRSVAAALEEGAPRPVGRTSAVGGGAPDRRARARDRGVQARSSTGRSTARLEGREPAAVHGAALRDRAANVSTTKSSASRTQPPAKRSSRASRGASWTVTSVETQGAPAASGAAVHHLAPAAGGVAQARLQPEAHDEHRAAALRGHRARATRARSASSPTCAPTRRASRAEALAAGARATSASATAPSTCPKRRNVYRSKKDAQDAHEAIRPTSLECDAGARRRGSSQRDELALYTLIWNRFVACQMTPARLRPDLGRHRGGGRSSSAPPVR